jgi:hypothetical protein
VETEEEVKRVQIKSIYRGGHSRRGGGGREGEKGGGGMLGDEVLGDKEPNQSPKGAP